jgi:DNA-binding CsgD family transcriptional regulator
MRGESASCAKGDVGVSVSWSKRLEALVLVAAKLARAGSPSDAVEVAVVAGVAAIGGRAGAFTGTPNAPRLATEPANGGRVVTVAVRTRDSTNAALSAELPDEPEALPLLELLAALLAAALDCDARIGSLAHAAEHAVVSTKRPPPRHRRARDPLRLLTARQRAVFRLIVDGHSNEGVARELEISVKTVETHRANINEKLGVHGPSELVRFAALHGLIAS